MARKGFKSIGSYVAKRKAAASGIRMSARNAVLTKRRGTYGTRTATPTDNKYINLNNFNLVDVSPGAVNTDAGRHLTVISQGTAITQRIGKKVRVNAIRLEGEFYFGFKNIPAPSTVPNDPFGTRNYDIVIVQAKKEVTDVPLWTDIFQSDSPHSPVNLDNVEDFKVLWRKSYPAQRLPYQTGLTGVVASYYTASDRISEYIKIGSKAEDTMFKASATGNAAGDIKNGAIFIMAKCDVDPSATSGNFDSLLGLYVRAYFKD